MGCTSRALATIAVWGGIVGLSYAFHSFDILSGAGAAGLVIAAVFATGFVWRSA